MEFSCKLSGKNGGSSRWSATQCHVARGCNLKLKFYGSSRIICSSFLPQVVDDVDVRSHATRVGSAHCHMRQASTKQCELTHTHTPQRTKVVSGTQIAQSHSARLNPQDHLTKPLNPEQVVPLNLDLYPCSPESLHGFTRIALVYSC